MKTEIEINDFKVTIEDVEGKVEIKAESNDEVIEELTLDPSDYEGGSDDEEELKAFGDEESEGEELEEEGEELEEEGEELKEEGEELKEEGEEEEMMGESIKTFEDMFPAKKDKK